MIRFILICVFFVFFGVFSCIALPITALVGLFDQDAKQKISQKIISGTFYCILFLSGTEVTVEGKENIPLDEPVLYVSNHRSYYDVVAIYTILPQLTGFVAKKEINNVPFLRDWMRNVKCVFLDRKNPREGLKTIMKAIEQVNEGTSMYIAPEGTRNHNREMLPFKPGSLKIAEKTNCPIVPVALTHTDDIYELHRPAVHKAHVTVRFGEPIHVKGLDAQARKELLSTTQDAVASMIENILAKEQSV